MWATLPKSIVAACGSGIRAADGTPACSSAVDRRWRWNSVQLAGWVTATLFGVSPVCATTVS